MSLTIDYRLVGAGWSECTIRFGEAECEISASYLSDALRNLVLAAVAVLAGAHSISVGFDEEPGEYRWAVSRASGDRVVLKVLEFQELWGNRPNSEGKVLLEASLHPLEFAEAVSNATSRVLSAHGAKEYKEKWVEHKFPAKELELLSAYITKWRGNEG
jgi:hypothetical protein